MGICTKYYFSEHDSNVEIVFIGIAGFYFYSELTPSSFQ